ncbi:MAG: hypothetical protein IJS04_08815 [Muribaculaceae bacterium]|nr:hypothetical protein [Muribaculaceae bacterium]MBQ7205924.1 hypothetical protein [Muribaculaceae bacterium]
MTIEQVIQFFIHKEKTSCPLTERLVGAGYQQKDGGYIKRARKEGKEIDYKRNLPSQYWHLMTFCYSRPAQEKFTKTIQCGELIFWMAEVADCVPKADMADLVEEISKNAIKSTEERPVYDRRHWNREIQRLCFDAIKNKVENSK